MKVAGDFKWKTIKTLDIYQAEKNMRSYKKGKMKKQYYESACVFGCCDVLCYNISNTTMACYALCRFFVERAPGKARMSGIVLVTTARFVVTVFDANLQEYCFSRLL